MFKNVPFAQPPIGNLRFRLPKWPKPYDDVRNATEYSPACWSNSTTKTDSNFAPMSEDCLYLNVFTSEFCLKTKSCQTIIYYPGGGINLDNAIMFNDTFILERYVKNGIIFIIPAYRLGVFGLFYLGDDNLVPHNLAIHDCELALRFIHQEISHFGGHPDDINLMGHSAGAHIAMIFGMSRLIDPEIQLFKKIIAISPVPSYDMPELLIKNCYDLAERVGCHKQTTNEINDDEKIVECLRKKEAQELILMQREMENEYLYLWNFLKGQPFMQMNQSIADFKKNAVARDMYIGNTVDEVGWARPKKENPAISGSFMDWENPFEVAANFDDYHDNSPNGTVYQAFSQGIFVSTATYSVAMANAGGKVFLFQTNQQPGSSHVSDMQYFVGLHREETHTHDMDIMNSFYSQMIVNFTKYGAPSPEWSTLNPSKMNYFALEVDTKNQIFPKMKEDFHSEDVNFWFINMTAFDREVTRQKQLAAPISPSLVYPMYPGPVIIPDSSHESSVYDVSAYWWFYVLVVVVAVLLFYLIYRLKRMFCGNSNGDEEDWEDKPNERSLLLK